MTTPQITACGLKQKTHFLVPSQPVLSHLALLSLPGRSSLPSEKHGVFCAHHHSHYKALYPESGDAQPEASILTSGSARGLE